MKVYLKRLIEETTVIDVGDEESVQSLKRKLMDEKGIPPCLQTLQLNGVTLQDSRPLSEYGVTEGASIQVLQASGCRGGGCMQIFAKMPNGEEIPLGAHSFDMIYEIKNKLADKLKMSLWEHHVIFNGKVLENHVSLAECDVVNQSVLFVEPKKNLNIVIKRIGGEPIKLLVDEYDTVKKVKERLFDVICIPPSLQNIIAGDNLLESSHYFKEYNLVNDSVVWLVKNHSCHDCRKVSVIVSRENQKIQLEMNSCDSVLRVFNFARQILLFNEADHCIKFNGECLDKRSTLAECGVSDGAVLSIERGGMMRIHMKTLTDKTITMKVEGSIRISQLKCKIMEAEGIPLHLQRIIFAGQQLENLKTLADYNVQNDSMLHMVFRVCGC